MKKILAVLALVFACLWGTAFAADFSHLVILHTNDTHGYDQRADGVNGMATVAALKEDYEAKGYKVLLVDAGDAIQDNNLVNFSKGKTAIDFMNAVGYDAMTLGNHEFDYGSDVPLARIKQAMFPIVSANISVVLHAADPVGVSRVALSFDRAYVRSRPEGSRGAQGRAL